MTELDDGQTPTPAGVFLREELRARGWSQVTFAEILGRPQQFVSEILVGRKGFTHESALQVAAALGTSPEFWLRLQDAHRLWQLQNDPAIRTRLNEVRTRARELGA